jgi:hypothetical protein
MLISPPPLRSEGKTRQDISTPRSMGVEVEVLSPGIYNGPDHKSLGNQPAGAIITIATGGYSSYLIEQGYVRPVVHNEGDNLALGDLIKAALVEAAKEKLTQMPEPVEREPEPQPAPEIVLHPVIDDPERPWLFWCALGIAESVALNLWNAGFTSASRTLELGEVALLSVTGIGPVRAKQVLAWSEANA